MKELDQILALIEKAPRGGAVLATLVRVEGSSYRRPGARILYAGDDRRCGSISGGCLEDDVAAHARAVLTTGRAQTVTYDTTSENDLLWGVGLGCHGVVRVLVEKLAAQPAWAETLRINRHRRIATELGVVWQCGDDARLGTYLAADLPALPGIEIFRETIAPPVALTVFGAGDDARPLVRMAKALGWHVTVADPRPAFATLTRFPEADAVEVVRPEDAAARLVLGPTDLAVVMTHHYAHDLPLLRQLLPVPLAYLGLLGPRKRAEKILANLSADGLAVSDEMRERLHAPVGLDLGADNPDEVALAILAEMTGTLAGRDARPLRERTRPIHG